MATRRPDSSTQWRVVTDSDTDTVVACAAIQFVDGVAPYYFWHNICVATGHRRAGLGLRLHRARLAWCRRDRCLRPCRPTCARLQISDGNTAALRLLGSLNREVRIDPDPETHHHARGTSAHVVDLAED